MYNSMRTHLQTLDLALLPLKACQYLHFCHSKASKLSTCVELELAFFLSSFCVFGETESFSLESGDLDAAGVSVFVLLH